MFGSFRLRIRTYNTDPDPAKRFGSFRIRIHNTGHQSFGWTGAWRKGVHWTTVHAISLCVSFVKKMMRFRSRPCKIFPIIPVPCKLFRLLRTLKIIPAHTLHFIPACLTKLFWGWICKFTDAYSIHTSLIFFKVILGTTIVLASFKITC